MKKTEKTDKNSESKEKRLKPKEELFCQYYAKSGVAFGNARLAYAIAFNKPFTTVNQKNVCDTLSQRLFRKVLVYKRVEALLNEKIDDEIVDKELAKVIQQGDNLHAKVSAITEYNKVRGRITTKIKHKFEGVDTEALRERLANAITGGDGDSGGTGSEKE